MAERRLSPLSSRVKRAGILAALAGVRLAADPVHRDRQRLVRLGGDRSEATSRRWRSASRSPRPARPPRAGSARPACASSSRPRSVARLRDSSLTSAVKRLVGLAAAVAHGVLERSRSSPGSTCDARRRGATRALRRRAAAPPRRASRPGIGARVAREGLPGEHVEADAADPRRGAREVALDQVGLEPDRPRRSARPSSCAGCEMPILLIRSSAGPCRWPSISVCAPPASAPFRPGSDAAIEACRRASRTRGTDRPPRRRSRAGRRCGAPRAASPVSTTRPRRRRVPVADEVVVHGADREQRRAPGRARRRRPRSERIRMSSPPSIAASTPRRQSASSARCEARRRPR